MRSQAPRYGGTAERFIPGRPQVMGGSLARAFGEMVYTVLRALAACAGIVTVTVTPGMGQRSTLQVEYRPRTPSSPLSVRDSILQGAPFAEIARAVGFPDLRDVILPPGTQELRLTDWYPMIYGSPVPLLRIVRRPGQAAAELYIWWGARRDSTAVTAADGSIRCGPAGDVSRVCVEARDVGVVADWDSLAAALSALAPCEREGEGHVADGGALLLQLLDGEAYRVYECNAPWSRSSTEAREAAAAMDLLRRLARRGRRR